ncbi:MAG: aldo/keto reductase [Sterolibacterium sp.]|nr:aldo/keto reductase [Sterolibacterium sp.]
MKMGLGTAQFGLRYGISNSGGQTPLQEVARILEFAATEGVHVLDTATLYGNSEKVLGQVLAPNHEFKIVTKTPQYRKETIQKADANLLIETFQASLRNLRQTSVYGLLIHNAYDLLASGGATLYKAMESLKDQGLVRKIGVSVYSGEQIDEILKSYPVDLVQLPVNVFDQRLVHGGHLGRLKKRGIEVHARSIFLQGLLLMEPDSLPPYFATVKEHLQHYREMLGKRHVTPLQAALAFVCNLDEVDVVLCGVENSVQLAQLLMLSKNPLQKEEYAEFALNDAAILNPTNWIT